MASATAPSVEAAGAAQPGKRDRGSLIEQTWIWSVVGYTLVRFFIAWGAFADHGVNVWIFGLIDVGSAWPYGKAVAVVCRRVANGDWSRLPVPLVTAVAMFFAPYAYLWFAAGEMPSGMRLGLVMCVLVLFVAATSGVIAKSRKLRHEARQGVTTVNKPADAFVRLAGFDDMDDEVIDLIGQTPTGELLIDLTGDEVVLKRSTRSG